MVLELVEGERPVVEGRGQPKAELDQDLLARPIVLVHAVDLRDGDVALVDHQQEVGREVVDQRPRSRASLASRQVTRVVLDPGAEADLAHHLEVEHRPLPKARRLQLPTFGAQLPYPHFHLRLDVGDRHKELVARRHVVGRGIEVHVAAFRLHLTGEGVDLHDPLHFVAEEVDPHDVLAVRRLHLQHVSAHAEPRACERRVVALVLEVHEVAEDAVAAVSAPYLEADHGGSVVDRSTEPVDAAHRRDDDHVATFEEGPRGVVPQAIDLVVPG